MRGNARMVYAKCFMACAGLYEQVRASRMMPNDLPPWYVVYQQSRALGWPPAALLLWLLICAYCCEKPKGAIGSDRAANFESRTLQSTPRPVATMRVMMEPRDAKAVKCMQPSIRWATCLASIGDSCQ